MYDDVTTAAPGADGAPVGSAWYGARSAQVIAFFAHLRRVPIEAWHRCAQADPHVGGPVRADDGSSPGVVTLRETQADQAARSRLREAMETMPGVVRRIRQRIEHEMAILDGIAPASTVTRMRRAARLAACAVAARPLLTAKEFARLYRPLAELIPPHKVLG